MVHHVGVQLGNHYTISWSHGVPLDRLPLAAVLRTACRGPGKKQGKHLRYCSNPEERCGGLGQGSAVGVRKSGQTGYILKASQQNLLMDRVWDVREEKVR